MTYYDIYNKRINRFGDNQADRLNNGRKKNFETFKKNSPHNSTFKYYDKKLEEDVELSCVLEPFRQNETKTLMHLLCDQDVNIAIGTIGTANGKTFLVYYLDENSNSGYNRYTLLKMSHYITWIQDHATYTSWAYFYYQEDNMLKNEMRSRSRSDTLYLENLKLNFLVMPITPNIKVGTYITIPATTGEIQAFRVTGYDLVSTPYVMYVSLDPTYVRDDSPAVTQYPEDNPDDFFWINGGE